MHNLDLVIMLLSTSTMALLGAVVLVRNRHSTVYKLFVAMAVTSILWSIANYTTNHVQGYQSQLFLNRLSLFIGFLLIQAVWLHSLYFPHRLPSRIQRKFSIFITPIVLYVTLLSSGVVAHVVYRPEKDITDIEIGNLFYLYVVAALIYLFFITHNFYRSYKTKGATVLQRHQVLYTSVGLILAFLWAVLTAAIIPSITNNWEISKYGAAGTLFLLTFTSYAIVKHGLFDIRPVVARSLGYILSILTLAGLYGILALFVVNRLLLGNVSIGAAGEASFIAIAVLLALTFQPLKNFFDKGTNKVFYKDAYDPQTFLNELNQVLVSTIDLNELLYAVGTTIENNLKASFCLFTVHETSHVQSKLIDTGKYHLSQEEAVKIHKTIPEEEKSILVADNIEEKNEHFKELLRKNQIAIVVRLITPADRGKEELGYLFLGHKKSGNPYNQQDIRILEIISNELVIATQNALRFEEIQHFNITLQEEVKRQTKQLREANERLRLLDRTKDDFISMASHQLRTPLTSVKGYLSMTLEGDGGPVNKKQRKLLSQAFISSQRMVYLIADMLNVSRLRTGKFVIELEPTDLADAVQTEIDQLRGTAEARGLKLVYTKPHNFPILNIDQTKIRQVIMNFVDNAIYYTPNGGHIEVVLRDEGKKIEFTVTDDGIGVPKQEQYHLFNKFYRARNAKKARPDGTGLGLYMAKKIIIAQGGSIIFRSREGKGSTFGFTITKAHLRPVNSTLIPASDTKKRPQKQANVETTT